MLGKEPFRIVFGAGVVRFDAHGNLFVNLPHTDDVPQSVTIGADAERTVAAPERRARVHGDHDGGTTTGSFPGSAELPRGLTVEVKGYESAVYADGSLTVQMAAGATIPDWWESGQDHHFNGDGGVRLWAKSSLPEGVLLDGDPGPAGPPTQPKPVARSQFQPKTERATPPEEPPAESPKPAPSTEDEGQPYRPGRLPAGHYNTGGADKKSGLGCSTLVVLVVSIVGALSAVL